MLMGVIDRGLIYESDHIGRNIQSVWIMPTNQR